MPATSGRERGMGCGGCPGADECAGRGLDEIAPAFEGLSSETRALAARLFSEFACETGGRLSPGSLSAYLHAVLVDRAPRDARGLTDLARRAYAGALLRLRVTFWFVATADLQRTALAAAIEVLANPSRPLMAFDPAAETRSGAPATVVSYVMVAAARLAVEKAQSEYDVRIVRRRDARGPIVPGLNGIGVMTPVRLNANGHLDAGAEDGPETNVLQPANLHGRPEETPDTSDWAPESGPIVGAEHRILRAEAEALQRQAATLFGLADTIERPADLRTINNMRGAYGLVGLDPRIFDKGQRADFAERNVCAVANYANASIWRERHLLPLIVAGARRSPGFHAQAIGLCDQLEALARLYLDHASASPAEADVAWRVRFFHFIDIPEVRRAVGEAPRP